MAVARESDAQCDISEVFAVGEQVQRAGQAQAQVIAIERKPFHLLKDLGEINGGSADLRRDLGERPTMGQIACEQQFHAIHQLAPRGCRARLVRRARPETAPDEVERNTLGLQRFDRTVLQGVSKECHESLGSRVDAHVLLAQPAFTAVLQLVDRRDLAHEIFRQRHVEARIITRQWMAHPVSLTRIEEQDVIGVCHCLIAANVPQVNAAIGINEVRDRSALFSAAMPAAAAANDVPHGDRAGIEQAGDFELTHGASLHSRAHCVERGSRALIPRPRPSTTIMIPVDFETLREAVERPDVHSRDILFAGLASAKAAWRDRAAAGLLKFAGKETPDHRSLTRQFGSDIDAIFTPAMDELRALIDVPKSPAWDQFAASIPMTFDSWHDGLGYDLAALARMPKLEQDVIRQWLHTRLEDRLRDIDMRDLEAAAALEQTELLTTVADHPNQTVRLRAKELLHDEGDVAAELCSTLSNSRSEDVVLRALDLVPLHATAEVRKALIARVRKVDRTFINSAMVLLEVFGDVKDVWSERPFLFEVQEGGAQGPLMADLLARIEKE